MNAEEKVFSIDDLRLIILSYALRHPDESAPPCRKILKRKFKKIYKNTKKKWEYFILKLLMKMWRIQIPVNRI